MMDNPKNDIDADNEPQGTRKSKLAAYLLLLGLSTLSALAIWSLWLAMPNLSGGAGLGAIPFFMGIIAGQLLLVIPATLVVLSVSRKLSRRNQLYEITPLVRNGIPLLFNILAASLLLWLFFISLIPSWYKDTSANISASLLSRNLTLTIKEESIVPGVSEFDGPTYHAVLHAENNNGQEISLYFSLGDYRTGVYKEDNWTHDLGPDSALSRIPPGDSDIIIDVLIYERVVSCNNDLLVKPIHLLYSLQGSNQHQGGFSLGKSINKQLQELACAAAP